MSRLKELCPDSEWLNTYAVSSGRPDRADYYFLATPESIEFGNRKWKEQDIDGHVFELKGSGTQVTAEGSVHPNTGGTYAITQDLPLIPFPLGLLGVLRETYGKADPSGKREWALPVHDGEGRDEFLIQQAGRMRHVGASESVILAHLEELNSDPEIMADPKSDADLERIAHSAARYDVPAPDPVAFIGKKESKESEAKEPVDWRTHYHTNEQLFNVSPPSFLIADFLQRESITAIAAPVGQRKSIIALNVAHALCTKEPLFDHFAVAEDANISRVLYLCPEMGLTSFGNRVKKIGLGHAAHWAQGLGHSRLFDARYASGNHFDVKEPTAARVDASSKCA